MAKIIQNVIKRSFVFRVTLKDGVVEERIVEAESLEAARLLIKRDANIRSAKLKK